MKQRSFVAKKCLNRSLSDFIVSRPNTPIISINNRSIYISFENEVSESSTNFFLCVSSLLATLLAMKNNIRVDTRRNKDNINFHIFLSHRFSLGTPRAVQLRTKIGGSCTRLCHPFRDNETIFLRVSYDIRVTSVCRVQRAKQRVDAGDDLTR